MLKHVAWRLQVQISIGAPGGLTAGADELEYDSKKEGKTWEIVLGTQKETKRVKSHQEEFQERQEDKTEVVYCWECLRQSI